MSIILHPLQHGPEERYAVSSHPGYMHTLQMACSALNTHDVWMVPWVWPYPAPLHLVSPLPNWYHGALHPLGWHAASPDEAPIQVLHTLSAWCTPRHQVCRQPLYGMPQGIHIPYSLEEIPKEGTDGAIPDGTPSGGSYLKTISGFAPLRIQIPDRDPRSGSSETGQKGPKYDLNGTPFGTIPNPFGHGMAPLWDPISSCMVVCTLWQPS